MKNDTLSLVSCPVCRSLESLSFSGESWRTEEIGNGVITCSQCNTSYPVHNGVPDLIPEPSQTVISERAAYTESRLETWNRIEGLSPDQQTEELLHIATMEHTGEQFRDTSRINLNGILELIHPKRGHRMLELGAGSGWLTCSWAARGYQCIATDISMDLKLELSPILMEREGVYFDRIVADMTRLPFTSAFDVVFVSASLHHACSLSASVSEAARVLRPGGMLVIINEPMHGFIRRSGKKFIDQAAEDNPGINEQSFNYIQWRNAFRTAGLKPRYYFPPYYREILSHAIAAENPSSFTRIASLLWRSPLRHLVETSPGMLITQLLLGMNVCLVARKKSE